MKKISRQLKYQQRQRALGRCILCPERAWRKGSSYCLTHTIKHRERAREYRNCKLRHHAASYDAAAKLDTLFETCSESED